MEFTIEAPPQGKERPRYSGKSRTMYTPRKTVAYEKLVREAYREAAKDGIDYNKDDYIRIVIHAYFPVPKSWSKTKKDAALLNEILPAVKPDADNIQKVILDALNGEAYDDDKQVIYIKCIKKYASSGHVHVNVDNV